MAINEFRAHEKAAQLERCRRELGEAKGKLTEFQNVLSGSWRADETYRLHSYVAGIIQSIDAVTVSMAELGVDIRRTVSAIRSEEIAEERRLAEETRLRAEEEERRIAAEAMERMNDE